MTDPNHAVLYPSDQEYYRVLAGPAGDVCHFLRIEPTALEGLSLVPGLHPVQASLFLRQRELVLRARRSPDALGLEEACLSLLAAILASSGAPSEPPGRPDGRLGEQAKELLANRFAEDLRLADLGRELKVSPYHLARTFRRLTGQSLHGYRTELRLRAAVDLMANGESRLASIATDCGFASHSHFTDTFRRCFGIAPGLVRRTMGR